MAPQASDVFSAIKQAVNRIPLIDNHAHNLLQSFEPPDFPRETLVSVAEGEALSDSIYSLAHIRMLRHLARFFNLPIDSSWQNIINTAKAKDYTSLCRDLIQAAGIQAILIEDGIQNDYTHAISWHDQLTPTPNKRIVRIETLFESIVAQSGREKAFVDFPAAIRDLVNDPEVVGFKSIAAYRSGLDVQPLNSEELSSKRDAAYREVRDYPPGRFRVKQHEIVTWLVSATCSAISGQGKPLQFHTGLGDNDITLTRADASLLQPLIKAYPKVQFVLLHAGYPYARQAGYLATVYPNVYLDFGLAIPLLSGDGQRSLIRQLLELCPTNKLLWSSDTAFHPERFYLAALQTREALTEVLADYVRREEVSFEEAMLIAKRMLFENANKLYGLGIDYEELGQEAKEKPNVSTTNTKPLALSESTEASNLILSSWVNPTTNRPVNQVSSDVTPVTSIAKLKSQNVKFIRLSWVDYANVTRYGVIPIDQLATLVGSQSFPPSWPPSPEQLAECGITLPQSSLGLTADDSIPPGVSSNGDCEYKPDFSTVWMARFAPGHAYMMGRFFQKAHAGEESMLLCPRRILQLIVQRAELEHGTNFLIGFETGFILLGRSDWPPTSVGWSASRKLQCGPTANCVNEIAQSILDAGIKLKQYHAESTGGQYNMVVGPLPPMQAADALVATREIIYNVARKHNLRATFSLGPDAQRFGTASHVHISLQSPSSNTSSHHPDVPTLPADLASFMAGLLANLTSVCMFTLPADASYARIADGAASVGRWVCWGRENKATPLRLCGSEQGGFNLDLKAFDGLANPYLGLAAVLAAGTEGLRNQAVLEMRDCAVMASSLSEAQRHEMGITTMMPTQNPVFEPEPELKKRDTYIASWLSGEAWRLYKDVRNHERETLWEEAKSRNTNPPQTIPFRQRLSTDFCSQYY